MFQICTQNSKCLLNCTPLGLDRPRWPRQVGKNAARAGGKGRRHRRPRQDLIPGKSMHQQYYDFTDIVRNCTIPYPWFAGVEAT